MTNPYNYPRVGDLFNQENNLIEPVYVRNPFLNPQLYVASGHQGQMRLVEQNQLGQIRFKSTVPYFASMFNRELTPPSVPNSIYKRLKGQQGTFNFDDSQDMTDAIHLAAQNTIFRLSSVKFLPMINAEEWQFEYDSSLAVAQGAQQPFTRQEVQEMIHNENVSPVIQTLELGMENITKVLKMRLQDPNDRVTFYIKTANADYNVPGRFFLRNLEPKSFAFIFNRIDQYDMLGYTEDEEDPIQFVIVATIFHKLVEYTAGKRKYNTKSTVIHHETFTEWCKRKQCIIIIDNQNDNLCVFWAIYKALHDKTYQEKYKNSKLFQKYQSMSFDELCNAGGIDQLTEIEQKGCSVDDIVFICSKLNISMIEFTWTQQLQDARENIHIDHIYDERMDQGNRVVVEQYGELEELSDPEDVDQRRAINRRMYKPNYQISTWMGVEGENAFHGHSSPILSQWYVSYTYNRNILVPYDFENERVNEIENLSGVKEYKEYQENSEVIIIYLIRESASSSHIHICNSPCRLWPGAKYFCNYCLRPKYNITAKKVHICKQMANAMVEYRMNDNQSESNRSMSMQSSRLSNALIEEGEAMYCDACHSVVSASHKLTCPVRGFNRKFNHKRINQNIYKESPIQPQLDKYINSTGILKKASIDSSWIIGDKRNDTESSSEDEPEQESNHCQLNRKELERLDEEEEEEMDEIEVKRKKNTKRQKPILHLPIHMLWGVYDLETTQENEMREHIMTHGIVKFSCDQLTDIVVSHIKRIKLLPLDKDLSPETYLNQHYQPERRYFLFRSIAQLCHFFIHLPPIQSSNFGGLFRKKYKQVYGRNPSFQLFAHNGSRFDNLIVFRQMLKETTLLPTIINRTRQLMSIEYEGFGFTLRDSYLLIPLPLKKFGKTFEIKQGKSYYPYRLHTLENLQIGFNKSFGSVLPLKEYYDVNRMTEKEAEEFDEWYATETNVNQEKYNYDETRYGYDLDQICIEYCYLDVDVLMKGLQFFQEHITLMTMGIDPLQKITIASIAMSDWIKNCLAKDTLLDDYMDERMLQYDYRANAALWLHALEALPHVEKTRRHHIRKFYEMEITVPSPPRQLRLLWNTSKFCDLMKITYKMKIDGYVPETNTVYIYEDEYWHGSVNPNEHYKENTIPLLSEMKRDDYQNILDYLRNEMKCEVVAINSKDFIAQSKELILRKEKNLRGEVKKLADNTNVQLVNELFELQEQREDIQENGKKVILDVELPSHMFPCFDRFSFMSIPIHQYHSFYGGRTEALAAYFRFNSKEDGEIISIDVTSMYPWASMQEIPCGVYSVIDLCDDDVIIRAQHDKEFHQKEILDKLQQAQYGCMKCLVSVPLQKYPPLPMRLNGKLCFPCGYLLGTWTIPELFFAIKFCDVRLLQLYSCISYTKGSDEIWRNYILKWMRMKMECSGVPQGQSIEEYTEKAFNAYGIQLRKENIADNPGKRMIAKLMLNSAWGKTAESQHSTSKIIRTVAELWHIFENTNEDDESIIIHPFDNGCTKVMYRSKNALFGKKHTNIMNAAYITSYARVHLLERIKLLEHYDIPVLYCDTDSVFFALPKEKAHLLGNEISIGNNMGEWSIEKRQIQEFVATGAKSYSIQYFPEKEGEDIGKSVTRCKGVQFTRGNASKLNHAVMRQIALGEEESTTIKQDYIAQGSHDGRVYQRLNVDKRIIRTMDKRELCSFKYVDPDGKYECLMTAPLLVGDNFKPSLSSLHPGPEEEDAI